MSLRKKLLSIKEIVNKPNHEPLFWIPEKGDLKCPLCGQDLTKYLLEDRKNLLHIFAMDKGPNRVEYYVFFCTKCRRSYIIQIDKLYDAIYELL